MVSQSILKKVFMALTGLGLAGFLVAHLLGNLLLLLGADKFNAYATMMEHNLLVIPAEIGLIGIFVIHVYNGFKLTFENNAARPQGYGQRTTLGESTFASRTMIWTGSLVFFFLIFHIMMFKFGDKHGPNDTVLMYELVLSKFKKPQVAIFYVISMLFLGLHLSHGLASAFQTLGITQLGWRPKLRLAGFVCGWALALGFAILPIWGLLLAAPPETPKPLIPLTSQIKNEAPKADVSTAR